MKNPYIKKLVFKILLFVCLTIFIPVSITLLLNHKKDIKQYSFPKSGKYISLNNGAADETLDVEQFIPCAIMGQLSIDNNDELLKAFSIIIRTYILSEMGNNNTLSASKLNIPYITYDELEQLWGDDFTKNYSRLTDIINCTSLMTITKDNSLIVPYYHSISAGSTRNGSEALGDDFSYLCKASCPDDLTAPDYYNYYIYTNEEFADKISNINNSVSVDSACPLENIQIISKDSSGYVLTMSVNGIIITGNTFYEKMQINSPSFMIEEYEGGVRVTTYGVGHGLGVSLNHAGILAKNGSSFMEILNYFFTGVQIH